MKKTLIVLIVILVLLFVGGIVALPRYADYWIQEELPLILNQDEDRLYDIKYNQATMDWWARQLTIDEIYITPTYRDSTDSTSKGAFVRINQLVIKGVGLKKLLLDRDVQTNELKIIHPEIKFRLYPIQQVIGDSKAMHLFWRDVFTRIGVEHVDVEDGYFTVLDEREGKTLMQLGPVRMELGDVFVDSTTFQNPFPISYGSLHLEAEDLATRIDQLYTLETRRITIDNDSIRLDSLSLEPTSHKAIYTNDLGLPKDALELTAQQINLNNILWGFRDSTFFLKVGAVEYQTAQLKVHHDNEYALLDQSKKPLYSKIIRELPFLLSIDTVRVSDSRVVYFEKPIDKKEMGKLDFKEVQCTGYWITNDPEVLAVHPTTKVVAQSKVMGLGSMKSEMTTSILDRDDSFKVKGTLSQMPIEAFNDFAQPIMDMEVSGNLRSMSFEITGNDARLYGTLKLDYNNLKVNQPESPSTSRAENWLKQTVGNSLIRTNNLSHHSQYRIGTCNVERNPQKGFFNFIWQGLKKGTSEITLHVPPEQNLLKKLQNLIL